MKLFINTIFFLLFSLTLVNCNKGNDADILPPPEETKLENATLLYEISENDLRSLAVAFGQEAFAEKIAHGIAAYKIIYKTTYKDEVVDASGVMYIPSGLSAPAPLLSVHHGTTFKKNDVASATGSISGMEYFAAGGYITFMPDFLGYGESSEIFHPYYDQKHSALPVLDLIEAGKEFLEEEDIPYKNEILLAGYSEGGYVTMAAAKEIDLNPSYDLEVLGIAAGAGGYDLTAMLEEVKTSTTYSYPAYLAFIIMSFNETYGWNKPLNYFFQEKYADVLPSVMDGTKSGDQINAQLTTNLEELFDPEFFQRLKEGQETEFQNALLANSFGYDTWVPSVPTRLYHGTGDIVVPVSNSEQVYNLFTSKGAKDVELIKIEGGTHGSTLVPMIQSLIPWFEELLGQES